MIKMLYGIVDIGSNTIRLKIYEYKNNKIKSVFSKKKTAGIIAYSDDGKLNDEGINILSSILMLPEDISLQQPV